jgi:hypothetical protein
MLNNKIIIAKMAIDFWGLIVIVIISKEIMDVLIPQRYLNVSVYRFVQRKSSMSFSSIPAKIS